MEFDDGLPAWNKSHSKDPPWSFWRSRRPDSKPVRSSPKASGPTDEQLIVGIKAKNPEAFQVLYDRYALAVRNVARFVLRDEGEAKDVRQECFLQIYQKPETFDPSRGSAKTWVSFLAWNIALRRRDYLASRKFYSAVSLGSRKHSLFADVDLEAELLLEERRDLLEDALQQLAPAQRKTLMLAYFENMDLQEISETLNLSHANVRHHYYRGLQRLKDMLAETRPAPEENQIGNIVEAPDGEVRDVPFKRTGKNPLTYLEKVEIDALLSAPNPGTKQGQKDHGLLLFLYNSGARVKEAAAVKISDLEGDHRRGGAVRLCGKGAEIRLCPLWPRTMAALAPLIAGRPPNSLVFLNRYGASMSRFGIHALVEKYAKQASQRLPSLAEKRVSPHVIRRTTAAHLLRAGVDINTIGAWLDHVSVDTTNVYAEVDLERKAKALAACDTGRKSPQKKSWRTNPRVTEFLRSL